MGTFTRNGIHAVRGHALEQPFYRLHGYTEAPVVIQCYLTLRCGFSCAHCLAVRTGTAIAEMPIGFFEKLCRQAAALGVEEMLLTGGEPLQRDDLGRIVDCLREYGMSWSLNTATCPSLTQQTAIQRYPPEYVAVSLDGPADVHNAFRGNVRAFKEATAAIRFFSEIHGTTVCAGTTVTTQNLSHLEETFALVRQSGAHRWGVHLLIPEGRANVRKDLFPTARQMRRLLKSVAQKRHVFPVAICDEMGFAGEWEGLVRDQAFYCAAGRAMCAVLPDGSVMPCSTLDLEQCEGNLMQHTLADVWQNGFVAQRTPRREGKCSRCKDWAICGSGCWLQRIHGTQCFKHLWRVPESVKAAASIGFCLGTLNAHTSYGAPPPELNKPQGSCSGHEIPGAVSGVTTGTEGTVKSAPVMKGIYGSKAGGGLYRKQAQSERAIGISLSWLKDCQNEDGTWGEPKQRVTLTALVSLAFLSRGYTPASEAHGRAIEQALRALVQQATGVHPKHESDAREDAVSMWCLAEAYSLTRIPLLRQSTLEVADRLVVSNATPWHVLAWHAASVSGVDDVSGKHRMADLAHLLPTATNDLLIQATRCSLSIWTRGLENSQADLSALRALQPRRWRQSREPLLCALLVNSVLAEAGGNDWLEWNHAFTPDVLKTQTAKESFGWWDVQGIGIPATSETNGMSEADARICTTAVMLISLPPSRILPLYRDPEPTRTAPLADTEITITIP